MLKTLFIWIAAAVLSAISVGAAMGAISKKKAPELALSLYPTNGFAAESRASRLTKASIAKDLGKFPDRTDQLQTTLAVQAFISEPLASEAIAVMALSRSGEVRRELMAKAFQLSRRQQLVTGWLIGDSGQRADIPAILNYYDTMLRTSSASQTVVIPAMVNALSSTGSIEPYADLLSANPPWASLFWEQAVSAPEAAMNAATLRERLYKPGEHNNSYRDEGLIWSLVKQRRFERAEKLYRLISTAPEQRTLLRNGTFRSASVYPPLDWQLISTGEYGADLVNESLKLSAISNSGGLFARQLVKLPKAVIKIEVQLAAEIPNSADLYISLSCAEKIDDKPQDITVPIKELSLQLKVSNQSSQCMFYWFDFVGRSAEKSDGFDIDVQSVSLRVI